MERSLKTLKISLLLIHMALLARMSMGANYPGPIELLFHKVSSLTLHVVGYFLLAVLLGWVLISRGKRATLAALPGAFL